MSWLYQRQYYWVPRQQTVRHSDGRRVITTRFGPRNWTRTTTHPDGNKSVVRSTPDGPITTVMGIGMLLVAPAAFLGVLSIPIYLAATFLVVLCLKYHTKGQQSTSLQTPRATVAPPDWAAVSPPAYARTAPPSNWSPSPTPTERAKNVNAGAFEQAIRARFRAASSEGRPYVDITSGDIHRSVGGYPGPNHRMPVCCSVMRQLAKPSDDVLASPPRGQGATLTIRYRLPR